MEESGEFAHMTGEYRHSVDTKGRVIIPSKIREELGDTFYVTISMDSCLCAYSASDWKALTDKVNAMPYVQQRKMRPLFANAAKCDLDNQGRALLPQHLRDYANLQKNVTVVGCNNHVELWDTEAWIPVLEQEIKPENLAAVMEELDF